MATTVEKEKAFTNVIVEEFKLGAWMFKIAKDTDGFSKRIARHWEEIRSVVPLFYRLSSDIFILAPRIFTLFVFFQIFDGLEGTMLMYFSSALLRRVEEGVFTGSPDARATILATITILVYSSLIKYFSWHSKNISGLLRVRVKSHFEMLLIKATIHVDLPNAQARKQEITAKDAWRSFIDIIEFLTTLLAISTHIALIVKLSESSGGPFFPIICVIKPIFNIAFSRVLWDKMCFVYVYNEDRRRMDALQGLTNLKYRQDLISNNMEEWILKEYATTSKRLDDVPDADPYELYSFTSSPTFDITNGLLAQLPIVFCALSALLNPRKFSVASIAILEQSSASLRSSVQYSLHKIDSFHMAILTIKAVYATSTATDTMSEGTLSYPPINEKGDMNSNGGKGMSFELRNVSFSYPGSQKTTGALNNTSMSIKPGQLVVIVGENGSGKSTIVRMLSRLYDPSSGEVLIDGHASSDYRINDLRQATVILSQDSQLFPLSLGENIGLGYSPFSSDKNMIMEAAEEGGASGFIQKLSKGIETVLEPRIETMTFNMSSINTDHPLYQELKKVQNQLDISGGERQRVAAARSFMRFKSGNVKFVAVDEPSSALDAEAELKLFERLIAVREGKTMVFVTHRFGHLTKYADQIICMKDGMVAESGTHEQLMEIKGEYAKLYNIQASAFIPVQ